MTDAEWRSRWAMACLIMQTVAVALAGAVAALIADRLWPRVYTWR